MANHKSALKRVRQTETRNERNRYQHKTMRNALKVIRTTDSKKEAEKLLPEIASMLGKLAKQNTACNLISSVTRHVSALK
jgi:small subunit ribosomal protein S20